MTNSDTAAEYIPTDEDMRKRHRYAWEQNPASRHALDEADAQWARWLAVHDARVRSETEARTQAVRKLHARALLSEVWGPGTWPIPGDIPVCGHCTTGDGMDIVNWPCPTIRALDDAP